MEVLVSLKSKADVLAFAINKACQGSDFDIEKADRIYEYIIGKINLPDVEQDISTRYFENLNEMVSRYSDMLGKSLEVK